MRIALAALHSPAGDSDGNLERLREVMEAGSGTGTDLVVLSEAYGQGYAALTDDPEADLAMGWRVDGPELEPVAQWARDYGVAVCLPFYERSELGLHSSAVVFDNSGQPTAHYRRISAGWRDRSSTSPVYVEGTDPVVADLGGFRTTIALCGDLWDHPDLWAPLGADLILWPLWRDIAAEEWEAGEKQAYAEQSRIWGGTTLLVNGVSGSLSGDEADGGATVFRDGRIVAEMPMNGPGVLTVDVAPDGTVPLVRTERRSGVGGDDPPPVR